MFTSVNTQLMILQKSDTYCILLDLWHTTCAGESYIQPACIIMPQYIHSDSVNGTHVRSIHNEHINQLSGSLKPWSVLRLTISRSLFLRSFALLVPLLRPYFLPTLVDFDGDTDGASGTFNDWNGTKQSSHAYVIVNCIRSLCCRVYNELDLCSY